MNSVTLVGRLVKDPDVRELSTQALVANFIIAVPRIIRHKQEGQPTSDIVRCVAFGKIAETIRKYVPKGMRVGVTGQLQSSNWTDNGGTKHYGMTVLVASLEFLDDKRLQTEDMGEEGMDILRDGMDGFMGADAFAGTPLA